MPFDDSSWRLHTGPLGTNPPTEKEIAEEEKKKAYEVSEAERRSRIDFQTNGDVERVKDVVNAND